MSERKDIIKTIKVKSKRIKSHNEWALIGYTRENKSKDKKHKGSVLKDKMFKSLSR